eukprot:jgi/Mesen1/751/ME000110S_11021
MTPESQKHALAPSLRAAGRFRVTGRLPSVCSVTLPLVGEVTVESAGVPIRSIEVQLLRAESILATAGAGGRALRDVSEIQSTQIADGDVCCGMVLPVHVVLPRLFTCPSLSTPDFSVDYEVNVVVVFEGGQKHRRFSPGGSDVSHHHWIACEILPLRLVRSPVT